MTTVKQSLVLVLIILMVSTPVKMNASDEQQNLSEQTKLIRIKKIANEWQGALLTLHTRNGDEIHGRLIEVSRNMYHLEIGVSIVEVPLSDVTMVSFSPGFPEVMLTIASAAMGAGFLGGAMHLVGEDNNETKVGIATLLGLIGGGLWGYSTFYESEVIYLE
ncbi:MAG: hypothetical protein K9M49_00790 [Candidatus Marinimicrobia bacterium]|nr:hypothetical protein [Candidatus Neomarinimicrobiota bacterium]MCF7850601.1 hypothetical protein [Candidatus Neomarinimicrobiota bacterium]MCF7903665.1 hypothetical protein [Candidatus Neomarinimicrobiota bacterium]